MLFKFEFRKNEVDIIIAALHNFKKTSDNYIIDEIIGKLAMMSSAMGEKNELDTVIERLLKTKAEIAKELKSRYEDEIDSFKDNTYRVMDYFNKKSPELMVQLFFIDMELKNLGYKEEKIQTTFI